MQIVQFDQLQSCGWLKNLYIDYKKNISPEKTTEKAILLISEYSDKNNDQKKEQKNIIKNDLNTPLIDYKKEILKNKYILIFDDRIISKLKINENQIVYLIQLLLDGKLKYEITIYSNYLIINLQFRLHNMLHQINLDLLNYTIYENFTIYTSLSSTLNIYKDDIIKQNTFEMTKRKLLLLKDLGPYNNLLSLLNKKKKKFWLFNCLC